MHVHMSIYTTSAHIPSYINLPARTRRLPDSDDSKIKPQEYKYLLSYTNVRELFNPTVPPSKQVGSVLSNLHSRRCASSGLSGFSEFLGMQGAVLQFAC